MAEQASGFIWYELMTTDINAAVAFYGKVVGWDIRDSGMGPEGQYLLFGKDGKDVGGIMAWKSIGMDLPTTWRGHIHTSDIQAETAAIARDGGTHKPVQAMPGVGSFAVASDPQGAEFLLFQPEPTEAPQGLSPHDVGAVGWHELVTSDWEKAWDFYSAHYGWTKHMTVDMGPMGTYQTFMATDTQGGGMMNLPPFLLEKGQKPGWLYYFTVDSIQAAKQRVLDGGGTVTRDPAQVPGGAWILQGTDPQGGAFALTAAS